MIKFSFSMKYFRLQAHQLNHINSALSAFPKEVIVRGTVKTLVCDKIPHLDWSYFGDNKNGIYVTEF